MAAPHQFPSHTRPGSMSYAAAVSHHQLRPLPGMPYPASAPMAPRTALRTSMPTENLYRSPLALGSSPASPSSPKLWQFDVYTAPFVPHHLQAINSLSAVICPSLPPPSVNFYAFISAFCGSMFLTQLAPPPTIVPLSQLPSGQGQGERGNAPVRPTVTTPALPQLPLPKELTLTSYFQYFYGLLSEEVEIQQQEYQKYDLYNVPVYPQDLTQQLFRLEVPGIRELTPPVQLGDVVKLRQIRPPQPHLGYPGGFTGFQNDAFVYGMDRTEAYLILRADNLVLEGGGFNVCFCNNVKLWHGAARAIHDVGTELKMISDKSGSEAEKQAGRVSTPVASVKNDGFFRRMLFPSKEDGVLQTTLSKGVFARTWFDDELNFEQQKAVDNILHQNYGNIPFLILGPPGTGKTKTIVETALQLIFTPSSPKHHILLCAPSQEAADTLALRLAQHLNPRVLFRLQTSARTFAEVPTPLMTYCYVENDMFSLPNFKMLMGYRVIVCSTRDAQMLVEARCTNRDLGRWEKSIIDSLRGVSEDAGSGVVEKGETVHCHWTALLVDEAAQGIEPEVAIPLTVIAPPEEASADRPIFVLAGDVKQLGAKTASKSAGLELSMFERLFNMEVYSSHPLSRKMFRHGWDTEVGLEHRTGLLPYPRPPFANLLRNYRSHPAILAVPSALFYNDSLICDASDTHRLESWPGFKGRQGVPVKFVFNSGLDESHEEGVSFYNLREVKTVVETVQSLLRKPEVETSANVDAGEMQLDPSEIAVMAPFREQVKRLRRVLRAAGLRAVNVGPVESYQGAEHRVVIICTTRARERFLKSDNETGLGLVGQERRVNVAITRAKEGLIVIGNPWILERDPIWMAFMTYCWRHDLIELDSEEAIVEDHRVDREKNKENQISMKDVDKALKSIVDSAPPSPAYSNATTVTSSATAGATAPVNSWLPPQEARENPLLLSRLEMALVYGQKAKTGDIFGRNGGWDEDDPMWTAGIAAEEAVLRNQSSDVQ